MTVSFCYFMLVSWFLAVPPAVAQVALDISEERIFERFTAWVDARFRGTLLAYLVRCPRCLAHWGCLLATLAWYPLWASLPVHWIFSITTAIVCAFAAARIAIKLWL